MARITAAFASSHSVMLTATKTDWQFNFREADPKNPYYYDRQGDKTDYAALLAAAPAHAESMVTPERMAERFDGAEAAMDHLKTLVDAAGVDVMIVVGDDQQEVFSVQNMPAMAIYYGETIRNAKIDIQPGDNWFRRAQKMRQEPDADRHYPVQAKMAEWLIRKLSDENFDIAAIHALREDQFEGHAFSFIHRRYLADLGVPVIPVLLNTFDPPNQPTARRCADLGAKLRTLAAAYPEDLKIGLFASGGLSHFVVNEELDLQIIDALKRKDIGFLARLDPRQLQAGSSEIRNWITVAAAAADLDLSWVDYVPGYRTPALTGTGLGFAAWSLAS